VAIKKEKTLTNGTSGNYWRIIDIHSSIKSSKITWRIGLFKDQEASDTGKDHLMIKTFKATCSQEELNGDRIALGYNKIRQIAESLITQNLANQSINPTPFDPDIAFGEDV